MESGAEGKETIFRGFGKDEHEASEQAQKAAFIAGWRHDNCSGWLSARKVWYGKYTNSLGFLWGDNTKQPPHDLLLEA